MKIFFSDLDGTLLHKHGSNLKPIQDNIDEIKKLGVKKIPFVIATGRAYKDSKKIAEKYLNIKNGYHICMNGGVIYKDDKIIFEKTLDKSTAKAVYDFAKKVNIKYTYASGFSKNEGRYYFKKSISMSFFFNLNWMLRGEKIKDEKFDDSLFENENFFYKFMLVGSKPKLKKLITLINDSFPDLEVFFTGPVSIEICPKNVNKGEAVKYVCNLENIDVSEAVFIGDSGNDIAAFNVVERSYCMKHVDIDIQNKAKYTVETVAEAIIEELKK